MKTSPLLYLMTGLLVTGTILSAQSLAEIAEKEKKRREKLPASKVLRNEDLAASRGGVSEIGTESEQADDSAAEPARGKELPSDWPSIFAGCRARYQAAKAVRDEKRDLIVTGLPIGTDLERIPCARIMRNEFIPGWVRYAIDCERLEEEVREQEAEMRTIQEECLNEARIRNVPPGEARLDQRN